jgi:hypothetical protein
MPFLRPENGQYCLVQKRWNMTGRRVVISINDEMVVGDPVKNTGFSSNSAVGQKPGA